MKKSTPHLQGLMAAAVVSTVVSGIVTGSILFQQESRPNQMPLPMMMREAPAMQQRSEMRQNNDMARPVFDRVEQVQPMRSNVRMFAAPATDSATSSVSETRAPMFQMQMNPVRGAAPIESTQQSTSASQTPINVQQLMYSGDAETDALEQRVTELETALSFIEERMAQLETRRTTVRSNIARRLIDQNIRRLETLQNTIESELAELDASIDEE